MATPQQFNRSAKGPGQVRCPACGSLVQLPATHCSACRADMRTGLGRQWTLSERLEELVKPGKLLKLVVTILIIIGLITAAFKGYNHWQAQQQPEEDVRATLNQMA